MPEIMMALGDFRYALDTAAYDQLRRTDAYRWQGQDRLGRRPAQQFTGHGASTVELDGTIYPAFRGGLGQITAMREAADAGTPLEMVDGTGRVWVSGAFSTSVIPRPCSLPTECRASWSSP